MKKQVINLKDFVKVSVRQLENRNQFLIYFRDKNNNDLVAFQSYATLIAIWSYNEQKLFVNWSYWDYSKTTSKHLKIFINQYTRCTYENRQQFAKYIINNDNVILFDE